MDYNGDTLSEASREREEILISQIDLHEANDNHIVNMPGAYEIDRIADRRSNVRQLARYVLIGDHVPLPPARP